MTIALSALVIKNVARTALRLCYLLPYMRIDEECYIPVSVVRFRSIRYISEKVIHY